MSEKKRVPLSERVPFSHERHRQRDWLTALAVVGERQDASLRKLMEKVDRLSKDQAIQVARAEARAAKVDRNLNVLGAVVELRTQRVEDRVDAMLAAMPETVLNQRVALAAENAALKQQVEKLQAEIEMLRAELLTQVEGLIANAELGKLVLGMQDGAGLQHTGCHYYAMQCRPRSGWHAIAASCATDPAEALRDIQEEKESRE